MAGESPATHNPNPTYRERAVSFSPTLLLTANVIFRFLACIHDHMVSMQHLAVEDL